MGTSKYVSDVKIINQNNEIVFNFLSDLQNFGLFFNEYTLAQLSQQIPKLKITDFSCDSDNLNFTIENYGEAGLEIIERENPKTIKISGKGKIPFKLFLWIQILPVTSYQSKMRLTLHAELNVMMKMLVGKKLEDGINKIADALTVLPYH